MIMIPTEAGREEPTCIRNATVQEQTLEVLGRYQVPELEGGFQPLVLLFTHPNQPTQRLESCVRMYGVQVELYYV